MMKVAKWKFLKKNIPMPDRYALKNQLQIFHIKCINKDFNPEKIIRNPVVLVCGDGSTLPEDVSRFEKMGFSHDVFCINRSMLFFQRPINHWAAIDAEESVWFSQNLKKDVIPENGHIWRHTIGYCPGGYDVFWVVDEDKNPFTNEKQKYVWSGNSGYFGILASLQMGYEKVVVAGMPLNTEPHWYETPDTPGPNWVGQAYRTWMDFKRNHPEAEKVRSLSGYSEFIFGGVTEKWLQKKS